MAVSHLHTTHPILLHVEDLHLLDHLQGDTPRTIAISPVGDLAIVVMIIRTFTGQIHGDLNATTAAVHPQIVTTGLVLWSRVSGILVPAGNRLGKIEDRLRAHHLYGKNFAEIPWRSGCSSHQTPGSNHTSIDLADMKRWNHQVPGFQITAPVLHEITLPRSHQRILLLTVILIVLILVVKATESHTCLFGQIHTGHNMTIVLGGHLAQLIEQTQMRIIRVDHLVIMITMTHGLQPPLLAHHLAMPLTLLPQTHISPIVMPADIRQLVDAHHPLTPWHDLERPPYLPNPHLKD